MSEVGPNPEDTFLGFFLFGIINCCMNSDIRILSPLQGLGCDRHSALVLLDIMWCSQENELGIAMDHFPQYVPVFFRDTWCLFCYLNIFYCQIWAFGTGHAWTSEITCSFKWLAFQDFTLLSLQYHV